MNTKIFAYKILAQCILFGEKMMSFLFFFVRDALDPIHILVVVLVCLAVGGIFDIWAVRQGKKDKFYIWEYNTRSIIDLKFMGVPIEDYVLFLFLTPLFIIIVWETVKKFFTLDTMMQSVYLTLGVILTVVAYRFVYKIARKRK